MCQDVTSSRINCDGALAWNGPKLPKIMHNPMSEKLKNPMIC